MTEERSNNSYGEEKTTATIENRQISSSRINSRCGEVDNRFKEAENRSNISEEEERESNRGEEEEESSKEEEEEAKLSYAEKEKEPG